METKNIVKLIRIVGAVLFISVLLTSCGFSYDTQYKTTDNDSSVSYIKEEILLNQKAEVKELPINVCTNRGNELVFDFSIDDYINAYNGYYYRDHKKRYILPTSFDNWYKETLDTAIHSQHKTILYDYSADRMAQPLPTISVYVPSNSDRVGEITLNFDWHSYSDNLYEIYNEMCYCTLKAFFPDFSDKRIKKLYSQINNSGYEHAFSSDEWYSKNSVPYAFYYKDGIGIYSHFAIGTSQRLCIIPITENTVKEFKEKGAKIFEIEKIK